MAARGAVSVGRDYPGEDVVTTVVPFVIPGRTDRAYYVALHDDLSVVVFVHEHDVPHDPRDPLRTADPLYGGWWDPAAAYITVTPRADNQHDQDVALRAHASVALWPTLTVVGPGHVRAWLAWIADPPRGMEAPHVLDDALRTGLLRMLAARRCVDVERCAALALTTETLPFGRYYV